MEKVDNQLPLLGRDWLYWLRLDWPKMLNRGDVGDPRVHTLHSAIWMNEFPEVTKEGLGLLRGIKAEVELKTGVDALVVKKKDRGIRICAGFKTTVNPHLRMKTFPLPTPDEVFSTLAHGESFSKLDLARAYKHMEVEESSRPYLLGLFRYRRLPFGNASAPAIWQKAMSIVLQGCQGTICYIDDNLVTGKTRSEHEENLRQVFRRLQQYGLRVKLSKCQFFQDELEFLGHTISREGVRPTKERVDNILSAKCPRNKMELKSFIGLMTYNVKFLPAITSVLHPLYSLLRKNARWSWGKKHKHAFKKAKELVSKAPVLAHYSVESQIKLHCDASSYGLGACLMHVIGGQEKPVAYASRVLTQAEINYAQVEREALAIVFAVKKFHQYLCGRPFTLVTDHRPLCKILGHNQGVPTLAAARMQRWALILSAYSYRIEYKPGSQNS